MQENIFLFCAGTQMRKVLFQCFESEYSWELKKNKFPTILVSYNDAINLAKGYKKRERRKEKKNL